jgi:peptide/nickel transport system permease protein
MSISEVEFQAKTVEDTAAPAIQGRSQWWLTWRRLRRDKAAMASIIVIVLVALCAILAPLFAHIVGHGPATQYTNTGISSNGEPVSPGTNGFILGTDELGRDLFVRIMYGAQISLFVGIITTLIGTVAGVSVGLVSGYFGGAVDAVLARIVDSVLAFPYIVLALSLAVVFGPSLPIVIAVISFFAWAGIARVVRGQVLSIREKEYIEAARSLGAPSWRIMFIDVLPNVTAQLIVYATLLIPVSIITEASLSFLGLGIPPPTADWGQMLGEAQGYYQQAWWFLVFPGLALVITTLAFNILGDGVRDALDPRFERL